jgi:hypothetical protein
MCRASEAFKTEVLKNAYKKFWTKNSNLIVKNKIEGSPILKLATVKR